MLKGYKTTAKEVAAGTFWVQPHKGKPCALLLGRSSQQLRPRWKLCAGDVISIGHTHLRVAQLTNLASRLSTKLISKLDNAAFDRVRQGHYYVTVVDKGRRYRRKAKKERRRQKKLSGVDTGGSSSDDVSTDDGASSGRRCSLNEPLNC